MDDIGSLIWRFGKRLIVSTGDTERGEEHHKTPAAPAQSPRKVIAPAAE